MVWEIECFSMDNRPPGCLLHVYRKRWKKNVTKTPSQNDGMTPDPHDFLKNLVGIVGMKTWIKIKFLLKPFEP